MEADEKPALAVVRELEGESSHYGTVDYRTTGTPRRSRYKPWGIPLITFIQLIVLVWELSSGKHRFHSLKTISHYKVR